MNYIFAAIIAMFCYGIADFFLKKGIDSGVNGVKLMFYVWLMLTILFGFSLYFKSVSFKITKNLLVYGIPSGIFVFFGAIAIVYALKFGDASVVIPISRLGLVVTAILAFVFLSEEITINKVVGIIFASLAIVFLTKS